jgi:hypothetical protein
MPGQTGPKTPPGKANSSQNARKHGLRSRKLLIGDERQEDFDRLAAGWRAEYEPEGQAGESLIERVILGDWFLRRAEDACMARKEVRRAAQEASEEESQKPCTTGAKRRVRSGVVAGAESREGDAYESTSIFRTGHRRAEMSV